MDQQWTREIIIEKVIEMFADAQYRDIDTITLQSTIIGDLNADSADFLDFEFRIRWIFNEGKTLIRYELDLPEPTTDNPHTIETLCMAIAEKLGVQWIVNEPAHA